LTEAEAEKRLIKYGSNLLKPKKRSDTLTLLLTQFKSPLILILIFAGGLSLYLDVSSGALPTNAIIIITIILISSLLGFWQERGAANAVEKLLAIVQTKATVFRDGPQKEIPVEEIVPGDVIHLNAGDLIPGDSIILELKDLFVNEASLTGETFPAEKTAGNLPQATSLSQRSNSLFMGTNVVSGDAQAVIVGTGLQTEFGKVSERLKLRPPETEFEHGVRHFGYLLMEVTLVLVVVTLAISVYFARPVLDSLLFSLALAVGLTLQVFLHPVPWNNNFCDSAGRIYESAIAVHCAKYTAIHCCWGSCFCFSRDRCIDLFNARFFNRQQERAIHCVTNS
jgi:Mg2+-importing ATPase